jgi:hypothetical protein
MISYFGQCGFCDHEWGFYLEGIQKHICDECLEEQFDIVRGETLVK